MTRGVRTIGPNENLVAAPQAMDELNIGVLPVCDGDRLIGVVTDRDIVVRGVAQDCLANETKVSDVMSAEAISCFEDESIDEVQTRMAQSQIRRLPVIDHHQHLVGMLSLGDLATKGSSEEAGQALTEISEPAEPDRSGQSQASGGMGGGTGDQGGQSARL